MKHATAPSSHHYAVAPSNPWHHLWWWLPLLAALAQPLIPSLRDSSQTTPMPVLIIVLLPLLGLSLSLIYRRQRIQIHGDSLQVRSTFYSKSVAVTAMQLQQARVINLAEQKKFKPARKRNGFGVPGFYSGHYTLYNNSKAFCLISNTRQVLVIPLHDGSHLLLSAQKPHDLLQALQKLNHHGKH